MYKCELPDHVDEITCKSGTKQIQPPGTRAVKVAIEVRPAEYPSRPKANKLRIGRKSRLFDDPGGAGYEIAKEVLSCPQCARDWDELKAAKTPEGAYDDTE
ncbi:MAG: hypothetical protein AAGH15_12345 [Myxococcota bacterium]